MKKRDFKVTEFTVKVQVKKGFATGEVNSEVSSLIDMCLGDTPKLREYHNSNGFKFYNFGGLKPLKPKFYREGNYSVVVRTVDDLMVGALNNIVGAETETLKAVSVTSRELEKTKVRELYAITPVILKDKSGYLGDDKKVLEERVKINLVKKWRQFCDDDVKAESCYFCNYFTKLNTHAIGVPYKGVKLLGDKVKLSIPPTKEAQTFAYFALGVGLGEMNARGFGFVATDIEIAEAKQAKADREARAKAKKNRFTGCYSRNNNFSNKGDKPKTGEGKRPYSHNKRFSNNSNRSNSGGYNRHNSSAK